MESLIRHELDDVYLYGNMFLIGNGKIGYRGTLEEDTKEEVVALNVIGIYDKYLDKWRESINLPNPLSIKVSNKDGLYSPRIREYISHTQELVIYDGIHHRETIFKDIEINSERFIPFGNNIILSKYELKVLKDNVDIQIGLDTDIYDINGPHFKDIKVINNDHLITFIGITNEDKKIITDSYYDIPDSLTYHNHYYSGILKEGTYTFYIISRLNNNSNKPLLIDKDIYNLYKNKHLRSFHHKWNISRVKINNKELSFYLDYSLYHLLILDPTYNHSSIPARGLSGQVYKGAIFWDTEIFLLPFYTLTNPKGALNLIKYRINTINGAKLKAKSLGYKGAFFAWESQDKGIEACSKYNVTDPDTGKPIRTYFDSAQIHISSDIAYSLIKYLEITNDYSILSKGGYKLLKEIAIFNMDRATPINGMYHYNGVIGPDEYHELVDDNAFTNYMIYFTLRDSIKYLKDFDSMFTNKIQDFICKIYLPKPEYGIIEQFKGYFKLEDISLSDLRKRIRHPNEYLGGPKGVATPTKIIKQADLITLFVLYPNEFSLETKKKNFDYYFPKTEHGSSLSSSMYSIVSSAIGETDYALEMFKKSSMIDLGKDQKMFAGGIFIGGTHPASNAGSYLSLIFGMCGLSFKDDEIILSPHLPKEIDDVMFIINFKNKKYQIHVFNDKYRIEEI